ncbi:hypothetical protein D3C85_1891600 [compost metagenome]
MLLNGLTTGDHLLKTVFTDTYWAVAGVDLSLLASAGIATWVARHLGARERSAAAPAGPHRAAPGAGDTAHA